MSLFSILCLVRFIPVYTGNMIVVYKIVEQLNGLSLCIQGTYFLTGCFIKKPRFIPVYTGNIMLGIELNTVIAVYPCVYREH